MLCYHQNLYKQQEIKYRSIKYNSKENNSLYYSVGLVVFYDLLFDNFFLFKFLVSYELSLGTKIERMTSVYFQP